MRPSHIFSSLLAARQGGRTLIELMVVVALGLLIVLGVGAIYLSANRSTSAATNSAASEDSGQTALLLIGSAIRQSQFSEIVNDADTRRNALVYGGPNALYIQGCTNQLFTDADSGDFSCTGADITGDALVVAYQADNVVASPQGAIATNCLGNAASQLGTNNTGVAATVPVVRNAYFLEGNSLMCLGNGNAIPQPLIDGVTNFKVYFGIDDRYTSGQSSDDPLTTSLRDAAWINAQTPLNAVPVWDYVQSVHVCIEIRGEAGSGAAGAQYRPCPVVDGTTKQVVPAALTTVPNAQFTYRTYERTFAIRSRRWATLSQ
jgi:type IV pilus assembly protein PilW